MASNAGVTSMSGSMDFADEGSLFVSDHEDVSMVDSGPAVPWNGPSVRFRVQFCFPGIIL